MAGKQQVHHQPHKIQRAEKLKTARPAQDSHAHLQKGMMQAGSLSHQDILALQKTAGNQAIVSILNNNMGQEQDVRDATGLPIALKTSVEQLSGMSLDDVRVHYNSNEPKAVGALAYTRGTDIHLRPGQEQHLAHEAWHVVQQKQGRVAPTIQMKNASLNNDNKLETEADSMGEKALQMTRQGTEHGKGCGCGACSSAQARPAAKTGFALPAIASAQGGSPAMGVIQRRCEICGSDAHKTSRCQQTKQQRDQHKEQVKTFQAAKKSTLSSMEEQEKQGSRTTGATEAFKKKHVVRSGKSLEKSSQEVAQTRGWGGGNQSGRSTVVDMSPTDLQKESRFAMESLKFSEAEVGEDSVAPKFGVVKPTKFNYPTQSSTVQSDRSGQRSIKQEEPELSKPVLALQGKDVHHLHGVEKDE